MSTDGNKVRIASGWLAGTSSADSAVRSFKGIPYAAPPVGALRWHPPGPCPSWDGVRPADRFGSRCIQPERPETSIGYFGPERESEDCLFLNVWTAAADEGERRPVMVWFHGGGYSVGSGSLPIFDGESLARAGVVLVTVNYRLGWLGYLAHPELSRESPHGVSGNYGLLDQIAALEWVRDNIAAFGGDADRVTIFGQSVGSTSVAAIMASPLAKSLIHRAIGQSGGAFSPPGRAGNGSMPMLDKAERSGVTTMTQLGARSIEDMRAMSAADVQLKLPDGQPVRPWPVIDGWAVSKELYSVFAEGGQAHIPLMTGSNAHEGSVRAPAKSEFERKAIADFGPDAAAVVEAYMRNAQGADDASRRFGGHMSFTWQNWTWARLHARTARNPTYYYHCKQLSPFPVGMECCENEPEKLGTFHTAEIPYVFGNLRARNWPWREADHRLSNIMSAYWTNFAASGNPNAAGLPAWAPFNSKHPQAMRFGDEISMGAVPEISELALLDGLLIKNKELAAESV